MPADDDNDTDSLYTRMISVGANSTNLISELFCESVIDVALDSMAMQLLRRFEYDVTRLSGMKKLE